MHARWLANPHVTRDSHVRVMCAQVHASCGLLLECQVHMLCAMHAGLFRVTLGQQLTLTRPLATSKFGRLPSSAVKCRQVPGVSVGVGVGVGVE